MISLRSLSIPMFALVAVMAGCTAETTPTSTSPAATTQQQQVASSDTTTATPQANPGHHGPPGFGGPDMLVGAALRDSSLNLTDAQKTTISGLKDSLKSGRPAFDASHATQLAAAIRSGNVSTVQMPALDVAKQQAHIADSAKAIQTLHDTLTADQRTQLVTDVQNHAIKGGFDHGDHAGPPAFAKGGLNNPHEAGGPFMADLNLTDAQKTQLQAMAPAKPTDDQIAQMKANHEAMKAEMNTKLESFKADSFDATAFVTPSAKFAAPAGGMDMHQQHLANLVKVLTPAQREILAQKIEAGPQQH